MSDTLKLIQEKNYEKKKLDYTYNCTFLSILELFHRYSPCTCGKSLTVLCCGEFSSRR